MNVELVLMYAADSTHLDFCLPRWTCNADHPLLHFKSFYELWVAKEASCI